MSYKSPTVGLIKLKERVHIRKKKQYSHFDLSKYDSKMALYAFCLISIPVARILMTDGLDRSACKVSFCWSA